MIAVGDCYSASILSMVRPVHLAIVSVGMPFCFMFLAIDDFSSARPSARPSFLPCSMAYSNWFILSRSVFMVVMYFFLSFWFMAALFANLRNPMNVNVYFVLNVLFVSSSFILNLETGLCSCLSSTKLELSMFIMYTALKVYVLQLKLLQQYGCLLFLLTAN